MHLVLIGKKMKKSIKQNQIRSQSLRTPSLLHKERGNNRLEVLMEETIVLTPQVEVQLQVPPCGRILWRTTKARRQEQERESTRALEVQCPLRLQSILLLRNKNMSQTDIVGITEKMQEYTMILMTMMDLDNSKEILMAVYEHQAIQ